MSVRRSIQSYLVGRLALGELHAYLHEESWDDDGDELNQKARRVIAEATSAHWKASALRRALRDLIVRGPVHGIGCPNPEALVACDCGDNVSCASCGWGHGAHPCACFPLAEALI